MKRLIDFFVPDALRQDTDTYRRARLCVLYTVITGLGPLFGLFFYRQEFVLGAFVLVGSGLINLSGPIILKATASTRLVGNLQAGVSCFVLLVMIGHTGGLQGVTSPWLITLPLIALVLTGPRSALVWAGVSCLILIGYFAAEAMGYAFPNHVSPALQMPFALSIHFGLVVVVTFIGLLFENGMNHAMALMAAAHREAEAAGEQSRRLAGRLKRQNHHIQKQAAQLQELDTMKSRFFANVSHEFRTPLTLILGPLQHLHDRLRVHLAPADDEQFAAIERNARRLLRLVQQILDLSQLEAGGFRLQAHAVDLTAEARHITQTFTPLAEQRQVDLVFEGAAPEPSWDPVYADPRQLEHILGNLLSNAFKFTPAGGRVTVRVEEDSAAARLVVADTGVGIPEAKQAHVFDRFVQGDDATTHRQEGTGIGLALVKELAGLHGGAVSVESTPGAGATFTVRLPRGKAHLAPDHLASDLPAEAPATNGAPAASEALPIAATPPAPAAPLQDTEATDRTTVLVVDDNAEVRRYVRTVLHPAFRVLEAADGQQGLEQARRSTPDLVLADVMMPRVDGLELTRRLKADAATASIPVVLLTARAGAEHEVEGLGTGADDYITKPFEAAVLEARVRGLIGLRHRLRRELRQELGAEASAAPPAVHSFLEQARTAVRRRLTDPELTVEALAEALALSRSQCYRRLKEETGLTPTRFIRRLRLEKAAELLQDDSGVQIGEVAYAVGFNSLSHFGVCFREHFGCTPSDYARQHAV